MRFLFDTDICIYLIKERPAAVLERFRRHSPKDCAISTITNNTEEFGRVAHLHLENWAH